MKLSTKARYAVMSLVELATHDVAEPVGLQEISDAQEISLTYLEQIFMKLRKAGLVESVRGPGGGYLLMRSPVEICVADVFDAMDESLQSTRCDADSHQGCRANLGRCSTHDLWEAMDQELHKFLSGVTLDDVIKRRLKPGRAAA